MSATLLAYIPALNQRHLDWFERHPHSSLFLITQEMAEEFLPRLERNLSAIPTQLVKKFIQTGHLLGRVEIFDPDWDDPDLNHSSGIWKEWILPDEDITRLVAEKYLVPAGCEVAYEMIWARWDMNAVKASQPVISDVEISTSEFDREFMGEAQSIAQRSPDWWRQIGAVAISRERKVIASKCNIHMPTEYETDVFGDPRINVDAGEVGKYTSIHAEESIISHSARQGIALEGARVYVTTFPCERCARQLVAAGIKELFFKDGYSALNAQRVLSAGNVRIVQVKMDLVPA